MKLNPDNAGWAVVAALAVAGGLAYAASRAMEPGTTPIAGAPPEPLPAPPGSECGTWGPVYHDGVVAGMWVETPGPEACRLQCKPGYQLTPQGNACVPAAVACAEQPAGPDAPYGWVSDGAGGCLPAEAPPEDVNCSDRQVWTGDECETPEWNRMPEPPVFTPVVWMPPGNQNEMQIYAQDEEKLDALNYLSNTDGVFGFQIDFNLVNSLLAEQGSPAMGNITLNEDGVITDDTRRALGWALSYQAHTGTDWLDLVTRSEELVA